MKLTTPRLISALAIALLSASALTACSGGNDATPADTAPAQADTASTEAANTGAEESAETEESTGGANTSVGGEWSATLDGIKVEIENATVACTELDGKVNIAIAAPDTTTDTAIAAIIKLGDPLTVEGATIIQTDGTTVAFAPESGMGSANATVDGNTYTVSGEAMAADMSNPTSVETKTFEIVATCN
ncbi:hypothetical protein EG850_11440 [Gulosibacter macacae]|uniref:Lipoprotein n=1 Tax=Gulosibacter macacae TaxID=2488791 RepID=A0A3P3VU38_9MICO|nr:lipoprotein LpqH [Gulosibacter macacae]RRJ85837.1 hypothetical protein EG850_11440 [Gulosibacter macacae]